MTIAKNKEKGSPCGMKIANYSTGVNVIYNMNHYRERKIKISFVEHG